MSDEFKRRYGEPSSLTRPVQDQNDTWVVSPSDSDKSYEELELERRHVKLALPQLYTLLQQTETVVVSQPRRVYLGYWATTYPCKRFSRCTPSTYTYIQVSASQAQTLQSRSSSTPRHGISTERFSSLTLHCSSWLFRNIRRGG